jgi:hypothetical protein
MFPLRRVRICHSGGPLAVLYLSLAASISAAYPVSILQLNELARSPILATCIVETTSKDAASITENGHVVSAHATLRILRTFPQNALRDQQINLDFEALAEGDNGMSGPALPLIVQGAVLILPLKLNPDPRHLPWRLIVDQGIGLVIPAITEGPDPTTTPRNGQDFILDEIASALSRGTTRQVLSEASYLSMQTTQFFSPQLMQLLQSSLGNDDDRWALVAASLLSSVGVPRPTVAKFRTLSIAVTGTQNNWSIVALVLQHLGESSQAKNRLIHQTLLVSDINSWGAALTLREFAQDPLLVRELTAMLKEGRPGSLFVAHEMIAAGQKSLSGPAITLSLHYIKTPTTEWTELQPACSTLRDFGNDEQFGQLVAEVKDTQYLNTPRYDALWRATIWPESPRAATILQILLHDDRMYQGMRYRDLAHNELERLAKPTN